MGDDETPDLENEPTKPDDLNIDRRPDALHQSSDDADVEFAVVPGYLERAIEWFRRAPIMGTLVLVFGTAVVVVPIVLLSLDDEPTQVDPSTVEFLDDEPADEDADTDGAGGDGEPGDGDAVDGESDDTNAGIYVGTATAQDPCGPEEYDVNLRFTLFGNGQARGEQLLTPGGNAFDTSDGKWMERVAILISNDQIWGMSTGDAIEIFNGYFPDRPGAIPEPDLDDFIEGMSDEEFAEAFGLTADACVVMFTNVMFEYSPFPASNPAD